MTPLTSNNEEIYLYRKGHQRSGTVWVNTSSRTRNVSLQNTSKSPNRDHDSNLHINQKEKSIIEYGIQENKEKIATEQLCNLLESKAYEDINTSPKDILTRGHPEAYPARGGYFSYWYNNNKTNRELQAFLTGPLQNTDIAKKLKNQIIRYEIDASYEILRKSHGISGDNNAKLPACLMLTKEDLFDENNNYLPKNSKVEINNSDEIDIVLKWYFEPTPFFSRCKKIMQDKLDYENNRSLENGMYSKSEVAKKLKKYLNTFENNLDQCSVNLHWQSVNYDNWKDFDY